MSSSDDDDLLASRPHHPLPGQGGPGHAAGGPAEELRSLLVLVDTEPYRLTRVESATTRQRMVIKQVTAAAWQNEVTRQRLQQEAEFAQTVAEHNGFLHVRKRDWSSARLIYEDCQCTLEQLLDKRGPLENDLVTNVLLELLACLDRLHGQGLAHGSLAASRVFVDPDGHVRLGDFVPYRFASDAPSADARHLLKYRAPEVLDNSFGDPGPWSDLYSLGYVMLEMFAGPRFPHLFGLAFDGQSPSVKWQQWHVDPHRTLAGWQQAFPQVSGALADLIDELIVKPAHERRGLEVRALKERVSRLGLHSRRVLPMYDLAQAAAPQTQFEYVPPSRIVPSVLRLTCRNDTSRRWRFCTRKPVIVGSDPRCDVPLPPSQIDSRHAVLVCQRTAWRAYDLLSSTGVAVNRVGIDGVSRTLSTGDELTIGHERMTVDIEWRGTAVIRGMDLRRRIHQGAGGDLYRAVWYRPQGDRLVALRVFPAAAETQTDTLRRLLRYVDEARRLRHPYIVLFRKAGLVRGRGTDLWYLAMEYMSHGSLRDRLRQSKRQGLSLRRVQKLGLDLCQALVWLENQRLVHRNINPGCLLFTSAPMKVDGITQVRQVAKLGDFLLIRPDVLATIQQITRAGLATFDLPYQSPELLSGTTEVTPAADRYSLAMCLYEAVTGRLPIDQHSGLKATLSTLHSREWPTASRLSPGLPAEWDEFFARGLARDPDRRHASALEFGRQLHALPTQRHLP
jgi:serine/threonine protein kinase